MYSALKAWKAALGDQTLGVVRLLEVLVTIIAACVTSDELVVEVDADPVGIGFDRQSAVSVCGRDGILIGVQGNAELAGGDGQYGNGNGSLMRILPMAVRFAELPTKLLLEQIHRASAITHRHPRSQMACGFYSLAIRELLAGLVPQEAFKNAQNTFRAFYEPDPYWAVELDCFQLILLGDLERHPESEIDSSGYVIHNLTASLWCLLTTSNYQDCVLKAVNLGGDTDTTGCVAGGLAGQTLALILRLLLRFGAQRGDFGFESRKALFDFGGLRLQRDAAEDSRHCGAQQRTPSSGVLHFILLCGW